jgi:uncharacterized membrane protein YkvA (DUF1232 family)
MSTTSFKISFTLDDQDVAYFRSLFRKARRAAKERNRDEILAASRDLVTSVRRTKKTPKFVLTAIESIEDLVQIIEDEDYGAPRSVANEVLAALAYFADPDDLIPDEIPVLGFLDDAIMIKFVEREFKYELAAYRKFRRFRRGAEQRPWTDVARSRLPVLLETRRSKLRSEVNKKKKADADKGIIGF